jgi:hypothetical protein
MEFIIVSATEEDEKKERDPLEGFISKMEIKRLADVLEAAGK